MFFLPFDVDILSIVNATVAVAQCSLLLQSGKVQCVRQYDLRADNC
ncbi:hypothetical protein T05_11639 [Trichinella murrelli]|uniref:Uncharacterized protein n=1 Tax=Trichinella murrelli TaxID=144512 RepID=A0A0V0SNV0_9BILA|nr:hypothetical protein T05_11639 [Trichinella murrelli]